VNPVTMHNVKGLILYLEKIIIFDCFIRAFASFYTHKQGVKHHLTFN